MIESNYNRNESNIKTGIVHIGIGRFHRAHEALYVDELLSLGYNQWGICGVCILPFDRYIYSTLSSQNGIYYLIERGENEEKVKRIKSIIEVLYGYENPESVFNKLSSEDVKLVTFTITEAGYFFDPTTKKLDFTNTNIQHDLENPTTPHTLFGYLARGLFLRKQANIQPFTVQSCDNIQGNGDLVQSLLIEFCQRVYPADFVEYIQNNVKFPNSMVDRITPAASPTELQYLQNTLNLHDDQIPVTSESYRQWVIEDNYCNERPPWELVGVQLTDSVKPYEKMKVRLLNAGHSSIGYSGHLAGYELIHNVASDLLFQKYLRLFFKQVTVTLPTLPNINFLDYQEILIQRFSNSAIEDQVLRICKDGSAKISGFIIPTLLDLLNNNNNNNQSFECLSFVIVCYYAFLNQLVKQEQYSLIDDPKSEYLIQLIKNSNNSITSFISDTSLFGNLSNNSQLMNVVELQYQDICELGIRDAMTKLIVSLTETEQN